MKLSILKEDLLKGLNIASHAISTGNTLPVLSNVLLRSEGNKLFFESTNLEIAIRYFLACDIDNEGEITLPSRFFYSYISLLKDETININTIEGNTVNIVSSNSKTQIKGLSSKDFPQIPSIKRQFEFSLPAKKIHESVSQVVFAAAVNSVRPILSGVMLLGNKNQIKIVATDSFRLSEKVLKLDQELEGEFKIIVPAKTMIEIGRLAHESLDENFNIIVSDNQILFKINNIELYSRLIDGQFPNYEQVIPQNGKSKIIVDKDELAQNIKRISLFSKENNHNIKLFVSPEDKSLTITTDITQIGTEESTLQAEIEGDEVKIALNSEYLLDVLNTLPTGNIILSIENKLAPSLLKHEKVSDFLHVIMPLKL